MVFEAWEDGADDHGGDGGGAAPSKTHLRYVRAIMETAISASVGHRHVVRCSLHSCLTCGAMTFQAGRWRAAKQSVCEQVATYHYDIKRVNDQLADGERPSGGAGSLQVRACPLLLSFTLPRPAFTLIILLPHLHSQVKGPAASLEITHSSAASGIQAFKVFLVQVRPLLAVMSTWRETWRKESNAWLVLVRAGAVHVLAAHGAAPGRVCERDAGHQNGAPRHSRMRWLKRRGVRSASLPATSALVPGVLAAQSTVVQVLSQIASGLEYLHGQGIIHGGAPG